LKLERLLNKIMISQGGGYRPLLFLLATMTLGLDVIARPSEPSDSFGPVVGQFLKASSSVIVPETLRLEPGSLVGFSFRTCLPGELLKQKGDGPDEIKLLLDEQGRLVLQIYSASELVEQAIVQTETKTKIQLNDGRWHTVILSVDEKTRFLTVNVSHDVNGGSAVLKGTAVPASTSLRVCPSCMWAGVPWPAYKRVPVFTCLIVTSPARLYNYLA